jgi:hypothetical protein
MVKNYFLRVLGNYVGTFRQLDRRFVYTILIDFLFILLLTVTVQVVGKGMDNIIPADYPLKAKLQGMNYMTTVELREVRDAVSDFKSRILAYSFAFVVMAVLLYTFSRFCVYSIIERKAIFGKGWAKTYFRFIALNLLLVVFSLALYVIFLSILYVLLRQAMPLEEWVRITLFILVFFFVLLLDYLVIAASFMFMRVRRVWASLKRTFTVLIANMHLALLPVLAVFLMLVIINILIILSLTTGELGSVFIVSVLLLCFVSFLRFYYRNVLDSIVPPWRKEAAPTKKEVKKRARK